MSKELKCKYCDSAIEQDDAQDLDNYGEEIYEECYGHCSCCGKEYKWLRKYSFVGYTDLAEELG